MDSVIEEVKQQYPGELSIEGTLMYLYSGEAELIDANDAGVEYLAADDRSELLGTAPGDFTHPDSKSDVERRYERVFEEGEPVPPVEEKFIDMVGNVKPAVVASTPLTVEGQQAVLTVAIPVEDVEDRSPRAEHGRREDDVEFEDIYDNVRALMGELYRPGERLELSEGSSAAEDDPGGTIPTSVRHEGDTVYVNADLPGVSRDEIRLQSDGDVLVIRAEGADGELSERVLLPTSVDLARAEASYHNGVVRVRFPALDDIPN